MCARVCVLSVAASDIICYGVNVMCANDSLVC
jgi:hypothetical protein